MARKQNSSQGNGGVEGSDGVDGVDGVVVAFPLSELKHLIGTKGVSSSAANPSNPSRAKNDDFLDDMSKNELISRCRALHSKLFSTSDNLRTIQLKYIKCRSELFAASAALSGTKEYSPAAFDLVKRKLADRDDISGVSKGVGNGVGNGVGKKRGLSLVPD